MSFCEIKPTTTVSVVHINFMISHYPFHLGSPLAVYQALSTFQTVLMLRLHELNMTKITMIKTCWRRPEMSSMPSISWHTLP
jgi:hypothetical protein